SARRTGVAAPCEILRRREEAFDDVGGARPILGFGGELLPAGAGDRVVAGAAVVLRCAPLRSDPSHLLELEQRRIERSLIQLELVAADLLDPPRDPVAVQRPEAIERLEDHQRQRAVEDIGSLARPPLALLLLLPDSAS